MDNLVAKSDRDTRKKRSKRIFTIQYKPVGTIVEVQGREIRKVRQEAGLTNQMAVGVLLFGMGIWICLIRLGSKAVGVEIGDCTGAEHL